ncbi:MAG: nucleotidyltransferase family protein [Clostridia bacterium]|nr:nucleotidyltransferase family protein [Clostridia bacterium]
MNKRQIFWSLVRRQICGIELSDDVKSQIDPDTLKMLHSVSKKYDISAIISSAILNNSLSSDAEISALLNNDIMLSVMRYRQMEHEISAISEIFEEANIPFIRLKGAFIRNLYPDKWMRTSCDIDILVREEELDRAVAILSEKLAYEVRGEKAYHDISLFSKSGVHLELHFNICENKEKIDALLSKVWDYAAPISAGRSEHTLTSEFMIFHALAHASYHFLNGGCGIRSFIDLYLLENKLEYDKDLLRSFCRECSIEKFFDVSEKLSRVWLLGEEHDDLSSKVEEFILNGGIYGAVEASVALNNEKSGGKLRYLLKRIFMPYKTICIKYPILKKHPYLTPFYQVRRWFAVLFCGRVKEAKKEISLILSTDQEKGKEIATLMDRVGLNM